MLKSREDVVKAIKKVCAKDINNQKLLNERALILKQKYNIPITTSGIILSLADDMQSQSEFVLYCVLDIVKPEMVEQFFTKQEIETYSKAKSPESSATFPLKFKMIQVADDQWIGSIKISELMQIRDAMLIKYNENAQRSMAHIVKGNTEYYAIALNKKAVNGIQSSMTNDTYIPNTITLNMPTDSSFKYSNGELIIYSMSQFDILDGYHRYVAMSGLYNKDSSFDYNMELRIVCFPEDKAKHFVWQEDQKTKMRKVDSESFNQNAEANRITQRLNMDSSFILQGQINRNAGVINAAELSLLVDLLWFIGKRFSKADALAVELKVKDDIRESINYLISNNRDLIAKPWSFKYLACVMVCIHAEVSKEAIAETAQRICDECTEKIVSYRITRPVLARLEKLI